MPFYLLLWLTHHCGLFPYLCNRILICHTNIMEEKDKEDNNPWRHHPLYMAYKKFYEGKNILMGRIIALLIAVIVIVVCVLLFS